mgnify:CR=1 FL=1
MLLDKIEEGEINWKVVIRNFYPDLNEAVVNAGVEVLFGAMCAKYKL